MNQFLGSLALLPIENILNAIVARDPHIAKSFAPFDSQSVEVVSSRPAFSLTIRFEDGAIKLSAIDSQTLGIDADATISGSAEKLLSLLLKNSEHRAMADAGIDISGDATLIQDLQKTIASVDIEWQDYLAPILGDVISHELGQVNRHTRDWSKSAGGNIRRNIRDYISEEARLAPSALEVDSFSNRLDLLRLGIDRATARTDLIERRLSLLSERK